MLGPDGDLVVGRPHHFPLFPLRFVGDKSSLDEGVVQDDIDDEVMPFVDLIGHSCSS